MNNLSPLVLKDFYKTDHRRQYPKGTELVYSNDTPRGSRILGVDSVVVFGIQYFVMEYLMRWYNERFFSQPKDKVVARYKRRLDTSLGVGAVPVDHVEALHDLGYLPLEIKALPEGSLCKMRVPFLTIRNTKPEFYWLTNDLETILSTTTWGPINSATIAFEYKKLLSKFAEMTSDIPEFVMWQGHDFSMRGMFGLEAALMSGAAHLLSFTGTDTVPAIDFLEEYYFADAEKELIGGSIYATEHSVMCMGGKETEIDTFLRLLDLYPTGNVSVVSDTWDYWKVLTETLPAIKDKVMTRDGKLVIRPDSGDPVKIICGDPDMPSWSPEGKGTVQVLWDLFGGEVNSKGYKQLDPHIGTIYGDSITLQRALEIVTRLKDAGFASTNVVLGIGSFTYQYNTRDTFGQAMKATYGVINGKPIEIFKTPKTDNGLKNSAKGLLKVNGDGTLKEQCTEKEEKEGLLQTIFLDGKLVKTHTLQEIRERLEQNRKELSNARAKTV
jgi:nicotinamide phosphoribosyltransferase